MRMALAAEADDRDLLVLDQVHVRIAVVINAHDFTLPVRSGLRRPPNCRLKAGGF